MKKFSIANAILWILILGIGMQCKDEDIERIDSDKESGSQIALRTFTRVKYSEEGVLEWKLNAKESYVFPEEDRTVFYEMKFLQYENGKLSSELESDWGEINHTTKKLELKGNIFMVTPDKKSLKTEYLNYDLETEELTTDAEVAIFSAGTYIEGKGLRAQRDLNTYTIIKPSAVTRGGQNPFQKD
ncbi:MAG: LPS export ABC transporter periplasmic protein LptC [Leptospira sp.]|nr:LPS export ABC transporter periplasmic protein LptC [Leptospira sp.]